MQMLSPHRMSSTPLLTFTSIKHLRTIQSKTPIWLPKLSLNGVGFKSSEKKKRHDIFLSSFRAISSFNGHGFISTTTAATGGGGESVSELEDNLRKVLQVTLWILEGVYIVWLFLLPYAPSSRYSSDGGTSASSGLFNFVIGWTLMFAPLLYTDKRRDKYKGSLDVLWGFQMFLTNTFLIPYMAIRLNEDDREYTPRKTSQLGSFMTNAAPIIGVIGGLGCLLSIAWSLYGRLDGNFGDLPERWEFLLSYLGSERLAYAFIWDICLYTIFQPWLIGENLQNIKEDKVAVVNFLRFLPAVGLVAYCLFLNSDNEV